MNDIIIDSNLTPFEKEDVKFGNFWERFGALIVDGLILAPLTYGVNYFNAMNWRSIPVVVAIAAVGIIYKPLFESWLGTTPGKMALRLKVVTSDMEKIEVKEGLLRNIFGIVFGIISMIMSVQAYEQPPYDFRANAGDFSAFFEAYGLQLLYSLILCGVYLADWIVFLADSRNRTLHDMIGKTLVVRK